jgi:SET domain-containing protein
MIKLEIKQSSLPFSGQGLFATHPIHQHEIIAEYYGSVIRTQHSMDKEFAYEDKMVQIDS